MVSATAAAAAAAAVEEEAGAEEAAAAAAAAAAMVTVAESADSIAVDESFVAVAAADVDGSRYVGALRGRGRGRAGRPYFDTSCPFNPNPVHAHDSAVGATHPRPRRRRPRQRRRPPRRCGARALARRSTPIPPTISLKAAKKVRRACARSAVDLHPTNHFPSRLVSSHLISSPTSFPRPRLFRRMVPIGHSPPYVPCTSPSSASSLRARSCCAGKRHLLHYRPNSPGALRPAPGFEPRGCM